MTSTAVLIPCKPLGEGKSRLSSLLSDAERAELCRDLLVRTLHVALDLTPPAFVSVITRDSTAGDIARRAGVTMIAERGHKLNAALTQARTQILAEPRQPDSLVILPIDLPLANAATIQRVVSANANIIVAGDAAQWGTNLLCLKGPAVAQFRFQYGAQSFLKHRSQGLLSGYSVHAVIDPALAFDLDEPNDYRRYMRIRLHELPTPAQ